MLDELKKGSVDKSSSLLDNWECGFLGEQRKQGGVGGDEAKIWIVIIPVSRTFKLGSYFLCLYGGNGEF